MPSSFRNLKGPARLLANSATVLLVASSFLAVEAVVMMILPDRDVVVKPFILLGYVEVCAMFFSSIGIVCGIVGLIFYHPYLWVCDKLLMRRARRAGEVSDRYTFYENIPSPIHTHSSDEDGRPD
ncbi:MAG: hypothetical protein WB561_03410 [Terracidiphilus sp.]